MVALKDIKAANALISDATAPKVAVFVGGTSGIGKYTIKALVQTGQPIKIYLVGRKTAEEATRAYIEDLNAINPKAQVIWIEGDTSLLAEVKRLSQHISTLESRIDLLFLSAGYAPFGARKETSEGNEIAQTLEYYSRILFIQRLMPLLQKSETPRVVAVLGGGIFTSISNLDDLDLKKPGNFSGFKARPQYVGMLNCTMDRLAGEYPDVTFIHSGPGIVHTGNVRKGRDPNSFTAWMVWLFAEPLLALLSSTEDECAQRHLFQCTSAAYGGRGVPWTGKAGASTRQGQDGGLYMVNWKCECTPNPKSMATLRDTAQERVWKHTQQLLEPYL